MIEVIKKLISISLIAFLLGVSVAILFFALTPIPNLSIVRDVKVIESTKIFDRNNELLFDFSENIQRDYIPLSDISENIVKAVLAIEDTQFYDHNGISIIAILRAFVENVRSFSFSQGGSTITQQTVKNILLTSEKRLIRKAKEIFLSIQVERALTKDEILESYLNTISFGGVVYGVSQASNVFFGKSADDITVAEAAYLAAIPRAPTYYSPFGNNKGALEIRKNIVLKRMFEEGFINSSEFSKAKNEPIFFKKGGLFSIKAPHFVFFVKENLERDLGSDLGILHGSSIKTTLDYPLQKKVEDLVSDFVEKNSKRLGAENAGVIVMNPKTGEILSMVGSIGYFEESIDGKVNSTTALRQPGSTLKPFIYSYLLENDFRPESTLFDVHTQFSTSCESDVLVTKEGCYSPVNYTGNFVGPVSIREALAQSINVPAVKALYLAGIRNIFSLLKNVNIDFGGHYSDYGLSIVLGGVEVPLLNLVNAYSIFPNKGLFVRTNWILETDLNGNISGSEGTPKRIISEETAADINDILSDSVARSPVFGVNPNLEITAADVAVKTGTTNNARDIWIVGYTPELLVGVWAGNNNGDPLRENSAGISLAPLWKSVLLSSLERKNIEEPFFDENTSVRSENVPPVVVGKWWETRDGDTHSILDSLTSNYDTRRLVSDGRRSDQYENWEYGISNWLEQKGSLEALRSKQVAAQTDNVTNVESDVFEILAPRDNQVFGLSDRIEVLVGTTNASISRFDYYINETLLGTSHLPVFIFSPSAFQIQKGNHLMRAVGYDSRDRIHISEKVIRISEESS